MPLHSRRGFAPTLVALWGLLAGCADDERPNVLLIMADDLGAAELGSYGNEASHTPRLDRLAGEGMRFETAYATPMCTPSRVLLLTGRYGFRTGWTGMIHSLFAPLRGSREENLGAREISFADLLKARGYRTAAAGKWQLPGSPQERLYDLGFDRYRIWKWKHKLAPGEDYSGSFSSHWGPAVIQDQRLLATSSDDYGPDMMTDFLIEFMKEQGPHAEQPFLAYYPMLLPHGPYSPTPDPRLPGERKLGSLEANLAYMDHLVGRLLDALEETGLAEETVVIFTADNGTEESGKGRTKEIGVRVPLIVRWPGRIAGGSVSPALTDLSDILPTLADLAGAKLPEDREIDGRSLKPILLGESSRHREWIFSYHVNMRILRDERWLLEGDGRFLDCADCRTSDCCTDVSQSEASDVRAARRRFAKILEDLPATQPRSRFGRKHRPTS
jgi:arylsulfatase A